MDNCDAYLINLKKDYGRYMSSLILVKIFNAKIIEGNDINELDSNGYLKLVKSSIDYTKSAKITKKNLLQQFLKESKKEYLLILEDDVYMHEDFIDKNKRKNMFSQLNNFVKNIKPKLLYLGISRHFNSHQNDTKNISFVSFYDKFKDDIKMCSGAYGVIISRDQIKNILMRIDNTTIDEYPFDLYCLSYISKIYPNESFVTNPHLLIPYIENSNIRNGVSQNILWDTLKTNKCNYFIKNIGILYIINDNDDQDNLFIKSLCCLTPFIDVQLVNKKIDCNHNHCLVYFYGYMKYGTKIKYNCGNLIINSILKNMMECKFLTLNNTDNHKIMEINYLNKLSNEKCVSVDI